MNKRLKRLIGLVCGAAFSVGAFALAACGNGGGGSGSAGGTYDGFGGEYIVAHNEGDTVKYVFEAENTDLRNKKGVSYSGSYTAETMVVPGFGETAATAASNGYCVTGLCAKGVSVNFVIVSDRDVENATLILRLGNECDFSFDIDADMFRVRIDPVSEYDLLDWTEGGAWGKWDSEFLDFYRDDNADGMAFAGYYIEEYECGTATVEAESKNPSGFEDFIVSVNLSLKSGVNSISLITDNNEVPSGTDNATMTATAPIVDCIKIITDAQLGLYSPQNNLGIGTDNACTYTVV